MSSLDTYERNPPWSQESKDLVVQRLHYDVKLSMANKPKIDTPIVQYDSRKSLGNAIYQDLDTSRAEIRVLDLTLLGDTDQISCVVTTASLNSNAQYAALSCEWGDTSETEKIMVNGHPFQATANLVAALRQFRKSIRSGLGHSSPKAIRLWVDAICINQKNVPERNSQVLLMGSIYMKAKLVFSWLGVDNDTALAIVALRGIAQNFNVIKGALEEGHMKLDSIDQFWLGSMRSLSKLYYFNMDSLSSNDNDRQNTSNYIWDALLKFANHSYWRRTWILQEIVLGRKVLLVAEDEAIDLDALDSFTQQLQKLQFLPRPCPLNVESTIWSIVSSIFPAWSIMRKSTNLRWQHGNGTEGEIGLGLVLETRTHLATDPRDKIFGLLGITDMGITADNSRSINSVYREFAERWIVIDNSLQDLLIYAGNGIHEKQPVNLPSWVPDWQQLQSSFHNFMPSLYGASGNPTSIGIMKQFSSLLEPFVSNNVLRTTGAVVSTVSSMSLILGRSEEGMRSHYEYYTAYVASRTTARYLTGISHLQALFRVTMRDRDLLRDKSRLSNSSQTYLSLARGFLRTLIDGQKRLVCAGPSFLSLVWESLQGLVIDIDVGSENELEKTLTHCLPQLGLSPGSNFASSFSEHLLGGHSMEVEREVQSWKSARSALEDAASSYGKGLIAALRVIPLENSDKRFFETSDGFLGLGPRGMQNNDFIGVLSSCSMPVVLRKAGSHYELVGYCFVLGLMDGETQPPFGRFAKLAEFDILEIH
jgi:hypothetical protein